MSRFAAAVLAIPALLLAADTLAQSEDFDPPPPPEEFDPTPPPVSDAGPEVDEGPRAETRPRGKRDRRRRNRNSAERDAAVALGGFLLGEVIEEVTDQPRSRRGDCIYERAGGWMQPTQGVYLDDANFDFINWGGQNSLNPQLVQVNPWGVYQALLPMIPGRPTALVGVIKYRDNLGNKHPAGDRSHIVIRGRGNCTTPRPVKVRFTLTDSAGSRVIYETPQLPEMLPLDGPRKRKMEDFQVSVPAAHGLPPLDPGAFTIQGENGSPYTLVASIVRADTNTPTKLEVEVRGTVQTTQKMVVQFVPIVLRGAAPEYGQPDALRAFTKELAEESWRRIPDVYPIRAGQLSPYTAETVALGHLDAGQFSQDNPQFRTPIRNPHPDKGPTPRQAWLQSRLGDYLGARAFIGAVDRVVGVVRLAEDTGDEFEWIVSAAGLAENSKVVLVPAPQPAAGQPFRPAAESVDVVAHELAHTLPRYAFSSVEMERLCGRDIHNISPNRGLGLQLADRGKPARIRHEYVPHMMGGHVRGPWWISQCTYAHLIGALAIRPDPELWLVRAIVSREGGAVHAHLMPGYDLMGVSDVEDAAAGDWSVRLLGADGAELDAWAFEPAWDAGGVPRPMMSVAMRIPAMPQARTLQISHRGAVVASRPISALPPSLDARPPEVFAGGRKARLRWTARSAGGKPLLASVYVSTDGGQVFDNRLFELPISQAIVNIEPAVPAVFKIVVSDGARSAERIVRLP